MAKKKWIKKSVERMERKGTVGSLRRIAKAKKGQSIPKSKLKKLTHSRNPKTRAKAQWAVNVGKKRRKK